MLTSQAWTAVAQMVATMISRLKPRDVVVHPKGSCSYIVWGSGFWVSIQSILGLESTDTGNPLGPSIYYIPLKTYQACIHTY